jgi:hypothetical protein
MVTFSITRVGDVCLQLAILILTCGLLWLYLRSSLSKDMLIDMKLGINGYAN